MKNPRIHPFILITLLFAAILTGFFFGRNFNRTPVQIRPLEPAAEFSTEAPTESGLVNINTATAEQLQALPGIGSSCADAIIAYREENGPFRSRGELMNVPGIGEKRLETLWDLITTGG